MSRHAQPFRRPARRCHPLVTAAAAAVGFASVAQSATFNVSWDGGALGSYNTAVNWSTNTVPLNSDVLNDFYNVTINRAGGANVIGNLSQIEILNLTIGANAGNQLTLADNCTFNITGTAAFGPSTVTNSGTIQLGQTASAASQFRFLGSTNTLTGGGTVSLIGANTNFFSSGTLTSNNTIVGFGNVSTNLAFVSNGTLTASGGSLTVDAGNTGGFDNNGLMQSIAGGTLVLSGAGGGTFVNTGATIANNGGRVNLIDGATIAGGTISTLNLAGSSIFFIPGGESATLSSVTSTADVNVGINGTLNLGGTITNNGRIRANNSAGVATFNVGASTVTLNGAGSLNLAALTTSFGNVIGTGTLVNGSSHLIVGAGSIGNDTLTVRNQGTISTGVAGQTLFINPGGGGMTNTGTLRATGGATLTLSGAVSGSFVNTGGTISNSGGRVNLVDGPTILNGTLFSADLTGNSAIVVPAGHTALLSSVTNAADVVVEANGSLQLAFTIANSGLMRVTGAGDGTIVVNSGGTTTLNGSGSLHLSSAGLTDGWVAGAGTLVNGASHSIVVTAGEGTLGDGITTTIRNNGTISLPGGSGVIHLGGQPTGTGLFNSGTIVTASPSMRIQTASVSNTGTILALSGGDISLRGTTISGGTIQIAGDGGLDSTLNGGGTLTNGTLLSAGLITVGNGAGLRLGSMFIRNDSLFQVGAGGAPETLTILAGATTLSGSGAIVLGLDGIDQINGVGTLNIAGSRVSGTGTLGNNDLAIVNTGTINATSGSAPFRIDPGPGNLNNSGTLTTNSGGTLILSGAGGGEFQNAGTIAASLGNVMLTNNATISGSGTLISASGNAIRVGANDSGALAGTVGSITILGEVVNQSGTLTLGGALNNNGTITLGGDSASATLNIAASGAALHGTGRLLLGPSGTGSAVVAGAGTLNNDVDHLIAGRGLLGNNATAINNSGVIRSDIGAGTLIIDPSASGMTNSGSLIATNGGVLTLSGSGGGSFVNSGVITAIGDGTIRLVNGAIVTGGTLSATNASGRIEVPNSSSATVVNVTLTGPTGLFVGTGGSLTLGGTVVNNTGIVPNAGSVEYQTTGGTTTLAGTGTLFLGTLGLPSRLSIFGTLINDGNRIRGFGGIVNGVLVNSPGGEIRADTAGQTLRLLPGNFFPYENQGVFVATNGGVLQLESALLTGGFRNTGAGAMVAENGSSLRLSNTSVTGGTLSTTGTGTIAIEGSTLADLTLNGRVIHTLGDLTVSSLTTANGSLTSAVTGAKFILSKSTPTSFVNNGSILLTPPSGSAMRIAGGGSLVNNGTLAGDFDFDPDTAASIVVVNTGLMETAGTNRRIRFDPSGLVSAALTVQHTGTLRANAAGTIEIASNALVTGSGTVDIRPGAFLASGGTVTFGATVVDGEAIVANSANLGQVSGSGTLNLGFVPIITQPVADATVTHSRVATLNIFDNSKLTTLSGGGSLGTSRVTSLNFINSGAGSLTARWDLTDHDLLVDYTVDSPFAGTLGLVQQGFAGGSWNGNGLTSSAAAGAPANARTGLAVVEAGELFATFPRTFSGLSIDSTTVLVAYTLLGDANLDRSVNIADFSTLAANFNQPNRWNRGDFNYDGVTGIGDFALLASNFNKSLSATLARPAPAPEPSVGGTVGLVMATTLLRRRH